MLGKTEATRAISRLSDDEAIILLYDWHFWARPEQLPPPRPEMFEPEFVKEHKIKDWFIWLILAGRGFGKTRSGAQWVIEQARENKNARIALVGKTKGDVRDTMIELGDSSILMKSPPWFMPDYEPSKRRVTWPNGAVGIAYSGDEPEQLRGPEHTDAWVDEFAKFRYPDETLSNLKLGMRIGEKPSICMTTTPKPIKELREIIAAPSTVKVVRSTWDNKDNLSEAFIREVVEPLRGTRIGRQEINAEILEDAEGSLWKRAEMIDKYRVNKMPELRRIVVAIDPATTSRKTSNEAGIVVCGVGRDNHGYVFDDLTIRASPLKWAGQAIAAYHKYRADRIIAETNNGGDMVEIVIRSVKDGKNVAYKKIHASRGKQARAEPVSALYERGRIHHVGNLPDLEDELCSWELGTGAPSPNRLDALVWAITELMLSSGSGRGT